MMGIVAAINAISHIWAGAMCKALLQGSVALSIALVFNAVMKGLSPGVKGWVLRLAVIKVLLAFILPVCIVLPLLPAVDRQKPTYRETQGTTGISPQNPVSVMDGNRIEPPTVATGTTPEESTDGLAYPEPISIPFGIWLILICLWVSRMIRAFIGTKGLRSSVSPIDEHESGKDMHAILKCGTCIAVSHQVHRPLLLGILKPLIIIPHTWLDNPEQQLEMTIAHEMAHVRNMDVLWNTLAETARILFFMNPLVWLAQKELRLMQEMEADRLAIIRTESSPNTYGNLLIRTASQPADMRIPLLSTGTVDTYVSVKRRLLAMKGLGRTSIKATLLASLVIFGIGISLLPARLIPKAAAEGGTQTAEQSAVLTTSSGRKLDVADLCKDITEKGMSPETQHQAAVTAYGNSVNLLVTEGPVSHNSKVVAGVPKDVVGMTYWQAVNSLDTPKMKRFFHITDSGKLEGIKVANGKTYGISVVAGYLDSFSTPPASITPPTRRVVRLKGKDGKFHDIPIPGRFIRNGKVYDNPEYGIHVGYVSLYLKDGNGKTIEQRLYPGTDKNAKAISAPKPLTGSLAPEFAAKSINGSLVDTKEMRGKPIILVIDPFTGPNPIPLGKEERLKMEKYKQEQAELGIGFTYECTELSKVLNRIKEQYGDAVNVIGCATGPASKVKAYTAGASFPVVMGTSQILKDYGLGGYTASAICIIKSDGMVRYHRAGYGAETEDIINRLSAELTR